eukprot:jgi/Orpsp1_1/1189857/evm.model.d7180000075001.1
MVQQFISKPNKILRCISNRTTALIYLIFLLKNETLTLKHFKSIAITVIVVIYIVIALLIFGFFYFQTDFSIQYRYRKEHPETKLSDAEIVEKVKHEELIYYVILVPVLTVLFIGGALFYYPYMKEVIEKKNKSSYNRMLESGGEGAN